MDGWLLRLTGTVEPGIAPGIAPGLGTEIGLPFASSPETPGFEAVWAGCDCA